MTFDRITKGNILPVYLLYGKEGFLIEDALNLLKNKAVQPEFSDLNCQTFHIKETDISSIVSACQTTPFISDKRVIIVKGIESISDEDANLFVEYIKKPCPTTLLIMTALTGKIEKGSPLFRELEKRNYVFAFNPISEKHLPAWIRAEIKKTGKDISDSAVDYLIETTGSELSDLKKEIEKLMLFAGNKKVVDLNDAEMTASQIKMATIFQFTDYLGRKDIKESMRTLARILKTGEEPLKILGMIARQFRILLKIKALHKGNIPKNKIAGMAGLSPYYIDKYMEQCAAFTEDELFSIFSKLYETDVSIKSSRLSRLILERLVINLCLEEKCKM